jgi:hypothetical protein
MIPDGPTRKVIWSNLEIVMKVAVESVVIFIAAGIILRESPLRIVAAIFVYTLFSFLLLGVNYLSLRWTRTNINVGISYHAAGHRRRDPHRIFHGEARHSRRNARSGRLGVNRRARRLHPLPRHPAPLRHALVGQPEDLR